MATFKEKGSMLNKTGRLLSAILMICMSGATAHAAAVPVIVKVLPGANISLISSLLGGTVIDSLPGGDTYLLRLPSLPLLNSTLQLLGVQWIEQNKLMRLPAVPSVALSIPGTL